MEQDNIKTVEMVRRIRDWQYEQTKHMNDEEKRAYYEQRAQIFLTKLKNQVEAYRREKIVA